MEYPFSQYFSLLFDPLYNDSLAAVVSSAYLLKTTFTEKPGLQQDEEWNASASSCPLSEIPSFSACPNLTLLLVPVTSQAEEASQSHPRYCQQAKHLDHCL